MACKECANAARTRAAVKSNHRLAVKIKGNEVQGRVNEDKKERYIAMCSGAQK